MATGYRAFDPATGAPIANVPGTVRATGIINADGTGGVWNPTDSHADPHDDAYDSGPADDDGAGIDGTGPVPSNIIADGPLKHRAYSEYSDNDDGDDPDGDDVDDHIDPEDDDCDRAARGGLRIFGQPATSYLGHGGPVQHPPGPFSRSRGL